MKKAAKAVSAVRVAIEAEVARQVRQHGRSSMKAEVCGVLIGREEGNMTIVDACIAGVNAAQGGAHVTFTQDTWQHIYEVKDKKWPDARIVGWYHSHPGFGVFLSDHDLFIHKNFFSSPQQIAWVYDPHNDEEGCFGWLGDRIEKVEDVSLSYGQPCGEALVANEEVDEPVVRVSGAKEEEGFWMPMLRDAAVGVAFLLIGGMATFYYLSRNAYILPREGPALVIIDKDHVTPIPPDIANRMLMIMRAQMDEMMKSGQLPPPASQQAAPGASTAPQGNDNGRKK
jgi:proteasome lid subunit RPN8/RPN11